MKYTLAFIIKFIMTTAVLWIVLGLFFNVSFTDILITSIILTAIAFAVDILILPRVGNIVAAVGDFALAYIGIWVIGEYFFNGTFSVSTAAFLSAWFIIVGELFYHRYLRNQVFDNVDESGNYTPTNNLQTEAGEELDPNTQNNDKKKS